METKFTRGNWRVTKPGYVATSYEDGKPRGVAVTLTTSISESEADAHLIAAAPDLYEMLSDALELATPCNAATPDAWSQRQKKAQRWEERTRWALAKARGEAG